MTFTIYEIALGILAANVIIAAALFIRHLIRPHFKYYGCVTGCDNGRQYERVNNKMEPVQCVYCLEVEAQRRHPYITQPITQYTREELEDILRS